jgi:hypothetical protein
MPLQVCKHFLDAIEKTQYGWFWVCPNGGKECKYRHALPSGYIFKTRNDRELEKLNKKAEISLEEIIVQQLADLGATPGTPVNADTLAAWKEAKKKRKADQIETNRKEAAKKSGGKGISTYYAEMFLLTSV